MNIEEVAQHLYQEWALRKDVVDPTYTYLSDGELPRLKPRSRWQALDPPEQAIWLHVAEVAVRLVHS